MAGATTMTNAGLRTVVDTRTRTGPTRCLNIIVYDLYARSDYKIDVCDPGGGAGGD